jgi:hypothetical protein
MHRKNRGLVWKRLTCAIISLILVLQNASFVFGAESAPPQEAQQIAAASLALRKTVWINNPAVWGLQDAQDVEELTLGGGLRLNYLKYDHLNQGRLRYLDDLVDDRTDPHWLYFFEHEGTIVAAIEIGKSDGSSYQIVGYSANDHYCRLMDLTRKKFTLMLKAKGNASEIRIYDVGVQHILAATIGNMEWALPTPGSDDIDPAHPEYWHVERLWTSAEIIQSLQNFMAEMARQPNSEYLTGEHPDFTTIPKVRTDSARLIWFLLPAGLIVLVMLALVILFVFSRRRPKVQ